MLYTISMEHNSLRKKPNILYFCSSSVFGGAERFVETCLEEHRNRGDSFGVYFLNKGYFCNRLLENSFTPFSCPFSTRLSNPFSWMRFQIYFYRFLKSHDFTHVHLTMAYSQIFAAIAARLAGLKVIWFQHGPIGGVIDKVANILPYDRLLFNSSYTHDIHVERAGKVKGKSSIIDMAIRTTYDSSNVSLIQSEYSNGFLLSMGRICRWKGYEVAIKTFHKLSTDQDLLIIGSPSTDDDKDYEKELKNLCIELKVESRVHFLGFKSNVHDYLKASDALIHCSTIAEPFGLVVSEAIDLGVYVFATKLGGVIDQVSNKNIGYLYDSESSLFEALDSKFYLDRDQGVSRLKDGNRVNDMMLSLDGIYNS
jgi:glycosyltransferase involved in cell wall biosynthesis